MRRKTREVLVGSVGVGGNHPIRLQSMTTSSTREVAETVDQILRLQEVGCEIVRVTVQGMKEAEACGEIRNALIQKGVDIPLVADIHFYPPAALRVADFVDKVRINPGNFADRRAQFKEVSFDDADYIEEKFAPLVEKCKKGKKAIRIGVNHGSLSDRIMSRYGDTPVGMVESAFEYARICRKYGFHDLIFSMKSSNPLVMVSAYRLLVHEMDKLGWDYPLHLGVTEAGEGEDGRVKSAMGIGALLLDGIGDTIRVSLTEDSPQEIDPARRLAALAGDYVPPTRFVFERREVETPQIEPFHPMGTVLTELPKGILVMTATEARFSTASGSLLLVGDETDWTGTPAAILFNPSQDRVKKGRELFKRAGKIPVILGFSYTCSEEDLVIRASAECGALLVDGFGDGVMIQGPYSDELRERLGFAILQSARMRSTKTEFISCPSCGRTLFNLQSVTEKIRERTCHLPGVKIAVMGCIVNGPGEMADAHFGYVGSKAGMIDLYVGKECVQKNIPSEEAVERLVALIKEQGLWLEPSCLGASRV